MRNYRALLVGVSGALGVAVILWVWTGDAPIANARPVAAHVGSRSADAGRCARIARLKLDRVEIASASLQPAGARISGTGRAKSAIVPASPDIGGLPEFCRVVGHIRPEAGSDIQFEVWLPTQDWDSRLQGVGNGGFAGALSYPDLATAVRAGRAAVSTDTGHQGEYFSGDWARGRPERIRDYGWRGVHLSTVAAKQVIASFYGRGPEKSYFMSCSNGGRQALMEASRFPGDYDGIVAGAPAAVWTDVSMAMIWTVQAQLPPGAPIRAEQTKLLQREALRQCDAGDGQLDGLVSDPRACRFDPAALACGKADPALCFAPVQVAALGKIMAGPRTKSGRQIAPAYRPAGAEVGDFGPIMGWDGWVFGTPPALPFHRIFPSALLQNFTAQPFTDVNSFDFDADPARWRAALAGDLDARPDMSRFFGRGGKLIIWHGWADSAVPPQGSVDFYRDILSQSGPRARSSVRLFMLPGVQHCGAGPGPSNIGQQNAPSREGKPESNVAAAMEAWVEKGRVPDTLVGSRISFAAGPAQSGSKERLICAEPAVAVLRAGDADKASSYVCRMRGGSR